MSSAKHTPRGEGRYGLIYCLEEIRQFEIPQHPLHFFFYDARYRRITPPTDPARRNIGSPHYLSDPLSIRLSVCLSPFLLFTLQSESSRVRKHAHGDVRRRHVDFYLRLPLSLARKYFLGSPLIYHNRRLSTRSKLWTPGQFTPFARRAIARVRNQLPLI